MRFENVTALIRNVKWRVILADILCLVALGFAIFAINTPNLWSAALIVAMVALVMAALAIAENQQ